MGGIDPDDAFVARGCGVTGSERANYPLFITDLCLGKQFTRILAEAGQVVEHHGNLFPPNGRDEEWLAHCGTHKRVALTHNGRIRYVPNEGAAVRRFKVLWVFVVQVPTAELARNFVPKLERVERGVRAPSPAQLHPAGLCDSSTIRGIRSS